MSHIISYISKGRSNSIWNLLCSNGWNMFNYCLISDMRLIFSFVFYLFIVSIRHLNWLIVCMLNCLVICNCFGNFNRISKGSILCVNILSIIWNLFMSYDWFVVSVSFLNWNIFNPGLRLRGAQSLGNWLSYN